MRSISSAEAFCAGLLGSAALHVGVFLGLSASGYADRTAGRSTTAETRRPSAVTVVATRPPVRAAPATFLPESPPAEPPAPAMQVTPPPESQTEVAASVSQGASAAASAETASRTGDEYVPRRYLTIVPKATSDITVFYPETSDSVGKRTAILALFIDETGVVQRVRIEGPPLPSDMEEAARNAFLSARFTPGEQEGRIVKSLIRVEVTFESTPLPHAAEAPTPPEPH